MIRMSTSNNNQLASNLWFVTLGTLHMQAFRPPQALHPLMIHSIAITDPNHVNTPISITRTFHCQSSDPFTQTQLRCATNRLMTLSTSILTKPPHTRRCDTPTPTKSQHSHQFLVWGHHFLFTQSTQRSSSTCRYLTLFQLATVSTWRFPAPRF